MRHTIHVFCSCCAAVVLILFCLSAAGAELQTSTTLRVATYNVENFFDRYDDPYINDMNQDNGTKPKKWTELSALARVIKGVNADVLALQEIENRGALEEFNRAYLGDLGYRHVILVEANNSHASEYSRGIDVALLCRVPVAAVTTYQNREFPLRGDMKRFSRDLLHVRLKPYGFPETHIFVLHAPSKLGERRAYYRRLAEARESAKILTEQFAGDTNAFIIIAGDFNDETDSRSLGIFTSIPGVPLTRLPALDSKGRSYTWYGGEESPFPPNTFDHLLVSRPVEKATVGGQAHIWNDADAAKASDHRPVYMTMRGTVHPAVTNAIRLRVPEPVRQAIEL
jgi:endonuclease/exonuclease/phosphatase family metal-dependent hydrolase